VTIQGPRRRWGSDFELIDMLAELPGGIAVAARDFALVTLAGQLSASFPGQLVFKGGFVLRHAYGHLRFSKDVDATRHAPPQHKFAAQDVAAAIRSASIRNVAQFDPGEPATDSARSLDFDHVRVTGEVLPASVVQVEVSYREAVVGSPVVFQIGAPFYEPFEVLTMEMAEMAAEKLRALAQRNRETDLADLAVMLGSDEVDDSAVARFAETKFELVKQGRANRAGRIEDRIHAFSASYDDVVPQLFPDAPRYRAALEIVWPRIKPLVPGGGP
jgi:predicted nucleotidyltransferase component of viral defense system